MKPKQRITRFLLPLISLISVLLWLLPRPAEATNLSFIAEYTAQNDLNSAMLAVEPASKLTATPTSTPLSTIHRNAAFLSAQIVSNTSDGASSIYAADVDADGDLDIIGASHRDDSVAWWENTAGDATTWTKHLLSKKFSRAFSVVPADVDGDNDIDILGAGIFSNTTWWENDNGDGSTWTEHTIGTTGGQASVVATDLDGDGDTDVLNAPYLGGHIDWWENTSGDGDTWVKHNLDDSYGQARSPKSIHAADVDGDGDMDVLAAGATTHDITWLENTDGDGSTWSKHTVGESFSQAAAVYAADVDGDGDLDILGAARNGDEMAWWENSSGNATTWTKHLVDDTFDGASSVHAGDLDGDGDLDIFGAGRYSIYPFKWWENDDGRGTNWTVHEIDNTFIAASSVYAADMNADGRLDILGSGETVDSLGWWENCGGQISLATTDTAPASLNAGTQDDLLQIVATHNGRDGDNDLELATFALLFEQITGGPLTDAELNALIESLHIYLDDGSGTFEASNDTLVTTVDNLSLTNGLLSVPFTDGDPNVQLSVGMSRTYFVVVEMTNDALNQTPHHFQLTHLTNPASGVTSSAEDRDLDLPLRVSCAEEVPLIWPRSIAGTVSTSHDIPLSDIQVDLYHASTSDGWNVLASTSTIAGAYEFTGLENGRYRICFSDPTTTYASECYDDVQRLNNATNIIIDNNVVSDIDAELEEVGQISGYVTDYDGNPVTGVEVVARTQTSSSWQLITSTQTISGNYLLDNLKPDTYVIEYQTHGLDLAAQYFFNTTDIEQAIPLPVSAGRPTFGVNAVLNPVRVITGTITFSGTESLLRSPSIAPFIHVYGKNGSTGAWHVLRAEPTVGSPSGGNPAAYPYNVTASPGGAYTDYTLGVGDHNSDFVFEYYHSQWPLNAYTFVDADPVPPAGAAIFLLDTQPSTIKGTVYNGPSNPVNGIRVHVLRKEGSDWNRVRELLVGEVVTSGGGNYEINGLAPGEYKLFFYDPDALGTGVLASGQYYRSSTPTPGTGSNFAGATIIQINPNGNVVADIDLDTTPALPVADITNNTGGSMIFDSNGLVDIFQSGQPGGNLRFETEAVCPNDLPPYNVELVIKDPAVNGSGNGCGAPEYKKGDYPRRFPMMQTLLGDSGIYEVTIPEVELDKMQKFVSCNYDTIKAKIEVQWKCPGDPDDPNDPDTDHSKPIGDLGFYDPSGFITDADTGEPVVGATVTLYKVPDWGPKTRHGDTTAYTCQSHNSKNPTDPWSQPAPVDEGVFSIPDLGEIRPEVNPQTTDEEGHYAWDVVIGCWYVVVEAEGYEALTSPVVGIPPEVTDLDLELTPLPPIAEFTASTQSGTTPFSVVFTDVSTGTVTSWLWDFGDGTTSDEESPTHTYAQAGVYSVSLTVSNSSGSDITTKTNFITVAATASPTATATASATPTATASATPTATASATPTATASATPTPTATASATPTAVASATPVATAPPPTETVIPPATATATASATLTASATPTSTASATPTPTATASATPTATASATPTATASATPTATASATPTLTSTPTATATPTVTTSATPTATASATATSTPTLTPTPTSDSAIDGMKFHDLDGDGQKDANEPGLSGWRIRLTDADGNALATTTTDANGNYTFSSLAAGTYVVSKVQQDGWIQTFPASGSHTVTLANGEVVENIDFGNAKPGEIQGMTWHDLDGDGVKDSNEPGLSNWTILLKDEHGHVISTVTDKQGTYSFTDLLPGTYTVAESLEKWWSQTDPVSGTHTVTLPSGQVVEDIEFGNWRYSKEYCAIGWGVHLNPNWHDVELNLSIRNFSTESHRYDVELMGLPGLDELTSFTLTPSSPISVAASSDRSINVRIDPLPNLNSSSGPYQAIVTNLDSGYSFGCSGQIWAANNNFWLDAEGGGIERGLTFGEAQTMNFPIHNLSDEEMNVRFEIEAMVEQAPNRNRRRMGDGLISLNGKPAGEKITGTISVPAGEVGMISSEVELTQDVSDAHGDLILSVDYDNDGHIDAATSIMIRSVEVKEEEPDNVLYYLPLLRR